MSGKLFVVGTPIGNLEDITYRAVETLKIADVIACEDTRHTKILLDKYQIKKPLISYHQHSNLQKIDEIIDKLKTGKNIAMVSDAGTPSINDPGGVLVDAALKEKIAVVPIPGPSALATLLSVTGILNDKFLFLGFLPRKKGRQTFFRNLMKTGSMDLYDCVVFYESPHRVLRSLQDMQLVIGNRQVIIGRELTKKFEEIFRGSIGEAIIRFKDVEPKGEFVVVIRSQK